VREGLAADLDQEGCLILIDAAGERHRIFSGDMLFV
jgi:hypothetical protein